MGKLFGTDGIRGIAGKELDFCLARRVGKALVEILKSEGICEPKILIGMDTRESSPTLSDALSKGITEAGGRAISIGVCSTPAVAFLLIKHSFDAGVMISASHNPYEYNGIKIFGKNGFKLSDEEEAQIESRIIDTETGITPEGAKEEYINYLKNAFGVSLNGLKIGIDCANGSASVTAEKLFTALGAECLMISNSPDGHNINENCGSTHLDRLKALVLSNNLDVGIAFDGDADRCIAIDEKGREVDGDFIMAILATKLKSNRMLANNTIVGTVMTNLGLKKFCDENGIAFKSAAVGDRFVLEMLTEGGYTLGGEQSGHIILPHLATTGDGQLTAIALLSQIKESGKSLSALADIMKKYPQITVNINADARGKQAIVNDEKTKEIIFQAEEKLGDKGRIIVRPSGTEALIRITVEGESEEGAEAICHDIAKKIKGRLDELKSAMG